uniref:C2H2-type domain-containing protein n=1 Tax=Micrurus paraensis TaxID=1970185 RepID=A0A2D4KNZ8_9SAUR
MSCCGKHFRFNSNLVKQQRTHMGETSNVQPVDSTTGINHSLLHTRKSTKVDEFRERLNFIPDFPSAEITGHFLLRKLWNSSKRLLGGVFFLILIMEFQHVEFLSSALLSSRFQDWKIIAAESRHTEMGLS